METELVIWLRFVERLLAVALGGLAVYLGYRLFSLVPQSKDSEGRVTLANDFSIVVSRVGPGVFFALFGIFAIILSLYQGISYEVQTNNDDRPLEKSVGYHGAGPSPTQNENDARHDARMLLRREIAFLNSLPGFLTPDLPVQDESEFKRAIARIKVALMKPVWGDPDDGWGTPADFEHWWEAGDHHLPPKRIDEAVKYFRYPATGAPP